MQQTLLHSYLFIRPLRSNGESLPSEALGAGLETNTKHFSSNYKTVLPASYNQSNPVSYEQK